MRPERNGVASVGSTRQGEEKEISPHIHDHHAVGTVVETDPHSPFPLGRSGTRSTESRVTFVSHGVAVGETQVCWPLLGPLPPECCLPRGN